MVEHAFWSNIKKAISYLKSMESEFQEGFIHLLIKYFVTDCCYGRNTLCCNTLTVAIVGSLVSDKCMLLYALAVNGVERSHQACPNSIPNIPQTTQTFTGAYAEST